MSQKLPEVREGWLLLEAGEGGELRLDSEAWFAWLEAQTTKSFGYGLFDREQGCIVGRMTVRKDDRQRGGLYWSVFRRQGGRLRRFYLGRSSQVTRARLEGIAKQLLAEEGEQAAED